MIINQPATGPEILEQARGLQAAFNDAIARLGLHCSATAVSLVQNPEGPPVNVWITVKGDLSEQRFNATAVRSTAAIEAILRAFAANEAAWLEAVDAQD